MSLSERLRELEQDKVQRDKDLRAMHEAEAARIEEREAQLLGEMRDSGVIPMIEDLTGPITLDKEEQPQANMRYYPWSYELKSDNPARQDESERGLTLKVSRTRYEGTDLSQQSVFSDTVNLRYQSRILTVSGDSQVYTQVLPATEEARELVENALFEAFSNPRVEHHGYHNAYAD